MRNILLLLASTLVLVTSWASAQARVRIDVDLSKQIMHVTSAKGSYVWPISSARSGYITPTGSYGVQRMEAMHRSHKYHNSPMPHSLFFKGGYAIHGSYAVGSLGSPASHGCVRLAPEHAAALFSMVAVEGARISIMGRATERNVHYAARKHHPDRALAQGETMRLRGTHNEFPSALGYAPVRSLSLEDWIANPYDF